MIKEFKVGDVVVLKSGGPKMTINNFLDEDRIECTWFDQKNILQYQNFRPELLKHYEPPRGPRATSF